MTDKQIIIDGVPVQDCCYFDYENDGYEDSCYIHQNECSAQNCYYKQLKRKEQECEELKEEIKKHNDDMFKNPPEKRFYCKGCTLPYISKKQSQTLTEIKEIAEILAPMTDEYDNCYYKDRCSKCEVKEDCQYFKVEQILQKISEVIPDEN